MTSTEHTSLSQKTRHTFDVSRTVYRGLWRILADWFRVPEEAPTLPQRPGDAPLHTFKPADGYLRYLKLKFWIVCILIDLAILVGWCVLLVKLWWLALLLAIPALIVAIVPDIIAYVAVHLRYDTMWYVISDRSLRIRRGIWIVHETTITFENIQNLSIRQGPVQRYFGISDIMVETAGGGSSSGDGRHGSGSSMFVSNQGIIEGIDDAERLRDLILDRLRKTTSAGLGDEDATVRPVGLRPSSRTRRSGWNMEHVLVLQEIRQAVRSLRLERPRADESSGR